MMSGEWRINFDIRNYRALFRLLINISKLNLVGVGLIGLESTNSIRDVFN
jgi:hypothetical protein